MSFVEKLTVRSDGATMRSHGGDCMNETIGTELKGNNFSVRVTDTLAIEVRDGDGSVAWSSSQETPPSVMLCDGRSFALGAARDVEVVAFEEDRFCGHRIRLGGYEHSQARLELVVALDSATDTLMVRVEEPDGGEAVKEVKHLYRFEKAVSEGGYLVLPHGSGHLIPADCPDELPGRRKFQLFIGMGWTMPWFGAVRGDDAMCIIVDDWWDCWVDAEHRPGDLSALDFGWAASLGKLSYPRGMLIHFEKGMDYVGMAKLYRMHAGSQGLVRTLEEKAKKTPAIDRYIQNILVRWGAWNPQTKDQAIADLRRFLDMGFGVNFFFPKWPAQGYSDDKNKTNSADAKWQAYLHANPVPGGWPAIAEYSRKTSDMGMVVQGFVCPLTQSEGAPHYDPELFAMHADGTRDPLRLGMGGDVERNRLVLDSIKQHDLRFDVLYYDGYSAYAGSIEDYSPQRLCSMRQGYEIQNQCFAETRDAGIIPGAELARFWCIADCDYFFFTDWSSDRLTNGDLCGDDGPIGEPVPLFQLVFHDCYIAGFSGGGYANYSKGYDWWRDATPRLYEMMFCSAPAFNWLPSCDVPVRDWESAEAKARFAWLKRWGAFYRAIAKSEMTAHRFLSKDRRQQRVEFANGVTAEFDMAKNLCRVKGVEGFSGDWESPAGDLGWYPCLRDEFDKVTWRP